MVLLNKVDNCLVSPMTTESSGPNIDESDDLLLRIVSSGMEKAAEDAASRHGEDILKHLLPAVAGSLAGPLASGAAAMVSVLIETLFKKTNATDRKLDKMLGEPFKTAVRTVQDILSEEVSTDAEEAEATRRLQRAADRLDQAYTYTDGDLPSKRLTVRLYQALVAALVPGGGASMRKYLAHLRALANAARNEAKRCLAKAESVKNRDEGIVANEMRLYSEISRLHAPSFQRERPFPFGLPSKEDLDSFLKAKEDGLRDRAAAFEKSAADMEALCSLIEVVHGNRAEILRSPKQQSYFKKVWQRFAWGTDA